MKQGRAHKNGCLQPVRLKLHSQSIPVSLDKLLGRKDDRKCDPRARTEAVDSRRFRSAFQPWTAGFAWSSSDESRWLERCRELHRRRVCPFVRETDAHTQTATRRTAADL